MATQAQAAAVADALNTSGIDVKVIRRADGTCAVDPPNTELNHAQLTAALDAAAANGMSVVGNIRFAEAP